MCCFTAPVDSVGSTKIFARSLASGRQRVAYEMMFAAKEDLAMILPLPVPAASPDDAVRFIDLKEYPHLFTDLRSGFPEPRALSRSDGPQKPVAPVPAPLPVVSVGDFEASFVPSLKDFSRLDARFRLPEAVWESIPAVKNAGFSVFKLKKGARKAHPMAFEFPRRDPARLFFPTLHIHDGQAHETAHFDHALYGQSAEGDAIRFTGWTESPQLASKFVQLDKAKDLVDGVRHVHLKVLRGRLKNEDVWV